MSNTIQLQSRLEHLEQLEQNAADATDSYEKAKAGRDLYELHTVRKDYEAAHEAFNDDAQAELAELRDILAGAV